MLHLYMAKMLNSQNAKFQLMFSQWPKSHRIIKRLGMALIRLCICAGWSESLLVPHTTLLEIACWGSFGSNLFHKFNEMP